MTQRLMENTVLIGEAIRTSMRLGFYIKLHPQSILEIMCSFEDICTNTSCNQSLFYLQSPILANNTQEINKILKKRKKKISESLPNFQVEISKSLPSLLSK